MSQAIHLRYKKKPSHLNTLFKAFRTRKSRLKPDEPIPNISATANDQTVNKHHLSTFNRICGIERSDTLQLLYPFTLAYPFMMKVLCRKEMPFSMFQTLNTRNSIRQYKNITVNEVFDIKCCNSGPRYVEKGFEIDIHSEMIVKGKTAWENTTTYLIRKNNQGNETLYIPPSISPLGDSDTLHTWFLDAADRIQFANVSGDTNGIHINTWYAKRFGFDRDFAQPIRIAAKCIDSLGINEMTYPVKLDFFLKGPVYYNNELKLKGISDNGEHRFDLFCGENQRPCISGMLSRQQTQQIF